MAEELYRFTDAETKILVNMYLRTGSPDMLNVSKLAELIHTSVNNPKFQNVLKILIDEGIIKVERVIGASKIITIDYGLLGDLITETELWKIMAEFAITKFHGVILHT